MRVTRFGSISTYSLESVRVYEAKAGEHIDDFRARLKGYAATLEEPVLGIHNDRYVAVSA